MDPSNSSFIAKYKGAGNILGCTITEPSTVNFNAGYCSNYTHTDKTTCEANSETWTIRTTSYTIGNTTVGDNGEFNNNIYP